LLGVSQWDAATPSHRRAQGDDEDGPAQLQQGVARVPGQRGLRRHRHHGAQDGGGRRVTSVQSSHSSVSPRFKGTIKTHGSQPPNEA